MNARRTPPQQSRRGRHETTSDTAAARIRILHLTTGLRPGGTESQLLTMLGALDRERYDHHLGYMTEGGTLLAAAEALGLPVHHLAFSAPIHSPLIWRDTWRLRRHIARQRYDLVVVYQHTNIWGALATIGLRRTRLIVMQRGTGAKWGQAHVRIAHRLIYPMADRIVVNAERLRRLLMNSEGMPADKIVVVHNGVDTDMYAPRNDRAAVRARLGLPADEFVIGSVARLVPEKGLSDLLDALSRIGRDDVHLALIGEGPLRAELGARATALGIEPRVHFLGERDDVADILAALDVGVLSSHTEGLPNALLECMSAGLPCVATDVGGVPEVVADGQTGLVVPPHAPAALEEALVKVIEDPDLARRWGEQGRLRALQSFSLEAATSKLETLFLEVAQSAPSGRRRCLACRDSSAAANEESTQRNLNAGASAGRGTDN